MVAQVVRPQDIQTQTAPFAFGMGLKLQQEMEAIGEHYGIYEAMARCGPVTPAELAGFIGIKESDARVWLEMQASVGAVHYSAPANRYCLWCPLPVR